MGLKKLLNLKAPEEDSRETNRDLLQSQGIPVKTARQSKSKFTNFERYSKAKRENLQSQLKPRTASDVGNAQLRSPQASPVVDNPYSGLFQYGSEHNPYSEPSGSRYPDESPQLQEDRLTPPMTPSVSESNRFSEISNPYSLSSPKSMGHDYSYGDAYPPSRLTSWRNDESTIAQYQEEEEEEDLNEMPHYDDSETDLNQLPPDGNAADERNLRQLRQVEEDEEVDRIKQDIRFTKQESLASTRNTLRMASEAEASGHNTVGMLGAQSERLYEVERNLSLAQAQNMIATDKVKEMAKIDKSFMLVHVTNPFNSKRRMQAQEEKIRNQITENKLIQQKLRQQQYQTERTLAEEINASNRESAPTSELHDRYDRRTRLQQAAKYQFENDKDDDEIELEISKNLDAIENSTQRLNRIAATINDEVNTQQRRWRKVEDDADALDMEIHLNNHRLNGVMK